MTEINRLRVLLPLLVLLSTHVCHAMLAVPELPGSAESMLHDLAARRRLSAVDFHPGKPVADRELTALTEALNGLKGSASKYSRTSANEDNDSPEAVRYETFGILGIVLSVPLILVLFLVWLTRRTWSLRQRELRDLGHGTRAGGTVFTKVKLSETRRLRQARLAKLFADREHKPGQTPTPCPD